MSDRRVVERDGGEHRSSEVNGGDLRMTLKNNLVSEKKPSEERTVIVKDEREVEERKRRKEEEKQREEERRIRKEEEKRREKRKADEAQNGVQEKPEPRGKDGKEAIKVTSPEESKAKKRRDPSSDSEGDEKKK